VSAARRPGPRPGLTLVECLVAILIIGLLVALLIPAVQVARERARRAGCSNNLRQIGLGLSNYASIHGQFPPAMGAWGYSYLTKILPYIEQRPLYDATNFSVSAMSLPEANSTVRLAGDKLFLCPSDTQTDAGTEDGGLTSYAGSRGIGVQKFGEDGMFAFPPCATVSVASVTDGLSATALVSEWLVGGENVDSRDPRRTIFQTPAKLAGADQFLAFIQSCQNLNTSVARYVGKRKGGNWMHGEFGLTLYNHTLPPNDHTCLNGTGYQIGAWTSGSLHPGGANSLVADGSVRFITSQVRLEVWQAFASRSGGEAFSIDDL
jgi:prepilin-type N-terminal cleavage/methylation domain-containing protein